MYASRRSRPDPNEPIWLVVQRDKRFRAFELAPDGNACVSFGSAGTATVKLAAAAPIAFTLERDADGVWVVPGYAGADLRVDAQRLDKAQLIHGRAVVELGEARFDLGVRDTPPTLRGGMTDLDDITLSDYAGSDDPLGVSDIAATIAIDRSSVLGSDAPLETAAYSRADFARIDPSFGDTKELLAMDFEGWLASTEPEPRPVGRSHEDTIPNGVALRSQEPHVAPSSPERRPANRITEATKTEELDAYAIRMALAQQMQQQASVKSGPIVEPRGPVGFETVPAAVTSMLDGAWCAPAQQVPAHEAAPAASESPVASALAVKASEPRLAPLEPLHTIELAPFQMEQPAPLTEHAQAVTATAPAPVETHVTRHSAGDTTSYDAAALKQAFTVPQVDANATVEQPIVEPSAFMPSIAPTTTALKTVRESPCVVPILTKVTGTEGTAQPSLLEQLGLLTKRHPVGVIGAAAAGSFFIVVFMVGVAHLLGAGPKAAPVAATPKATSSVASAVTARVPQSATQKEATTAVVPSSSAAPSAAEGVVPVQDPAVALAAGHLFAGRLAEAETAYRELATRHPEDESYAVLSRVLGRRNSADCRSVSETKKLCPTVKQ